MRRAPVASLYVHERHGRVREAAMIEHGGAAAAPRVAGLVLAAGRSTRMGHNKLLATVAGVPLVLRAAQAALDAGLDPVCVVTGHDREPICALLRDRPVVLLHNPDFAQGLGGSLATGVRALGPELDAVVVLLGDMPFVRPSHLRALVEAFERGGRGVICVPEYDGARGNPVLWPARDFAVLGRLTGDVGGRVLLQANAERVLRVPMPDDGVLIDVDSPQALAALSEPPPPAGGPRRVRR